MQHIATIARSYNSQLVKTNKTNCQSVATVDQLLIKHAELIEQPYAKWFAKRFYSISPEIVDRLASEARADGKNPARLFSYLIKKYAQST